MKHSKTEYQMALVVFCLIVIAAAYVHVRLWKVKSQSVQREDIYCAYLEGGKILEGVNPYQAVLSGNFRVNNKYATYFPLFYLMSSGVKQIGFTSFPEWLAFWRVVFLFCVLGIAYLIFQTCAASGELLLGLFGALFWLFNRWVLHVTIIAHLDFLPLLLFMLSLGFVRRRFSLACFIFGVSLAVKQIAIFALPLYLIWSWQSGSEKRVRPLVKASVLIATVPLLTSIPFLIWNAEGYIRSILFSATRYANDHFQVSSLDALFGIQGIPAKVPMLILLVLVYALALYRRIPQYTCMLLIMTVFFCFNSVLFRQYMIWFLPFIPLAVLEGVSSVSESESKWVS